MTSRTPVCTEHERACVEKAADRQCPTDSLSLSTPKYIRDEIHVSCFKLMRMLLSLLLAGVSVVTGDQRFVQEPQDVTSSAGARLVLPCRVEARRGECQVGQYTCTLHCTQNRLLSFSGPGTGSASA